MIYYEVLWKKILEKYLKGVEKILDRRIRNIVNIDQSQFDFMAGRSTLDAVFIARQLQEKYMENRKEVVSRVCGPRKGF